MFSQDLIARLAAELHESEKSRVQLRPTNAVAGDTFHADYGPLGSIAFRFV